MEIALSIDLNYILRRNKINLETFIKINSLASYNDVIEYCAQRGFSPCTQQEYESVAITQENKDETAQVKTTIKKSTAKKAQKSSRSASKTPKQKRTRNRSKKQQNT